ncbi:MAG: PD-(D/E)XK nuclease family protein [Candidatus Diapherotrites archaeon]
MFGLVEREFLPVSWLQQMLYCEHSLFLAQVKKIKAPFSLALVAGARQHAKLFQEFKSGAEELREPLHSYVEKIVLGSAEPISVRELSVKSFRFFLNGRIDELKIFQDRAIIIDDKTKSTASNADLMQLGAYALCFQEIFPKPSNVFLSVRDSRSLETILFTEFSEELREQTLSAVNRFHSLFRGETEFNPSPHANKCARCRFNFICSHSLYTPIH